MSNNIKIGNFYNVKSLIHGMNPTSKIICTLLFFIITLLSSTNQLLIILSVLSLLMIILGRLPLILFLKQILDLKYIYFIIGLFYYFNNLTLDSYILLMIKIQLIFISIAILTLTTKSNEITTGIEEFFTPFKKLRPLIAKIASNISLVLRFVPVFFEQKEKTITVLVARGITNNNIINKTKCFLISFKPTLKFTINRLKQIKSAMEVRLYNYGSNRSNYNAKGFSLIDGIMICIYLGLFAYITFLRMGII